MKSSKRIKDTLEGNPPIKLDFGCGTRKKEGFTGIDIIKFEGVDVVMNIGKDKWPWKDNSVEEAHASHFVEHLEPMERVHFVNELYRVLKPEGKALIVTPHWASSRAYGDLTHKFPPVAEFWFYYLDVNWRALNAPHNDFYKCHFNVTWGYTMTPELAARNQEYQQMAFQNYKEAAQDIIATFTKQPWPTK